MGDFRSTLWLSSRLIFEALDSVPTFINEFNFQEAFHLKRNERNGCNYNQIGYNWYIPNFFAVNPTGRTITTLSNT